MNQPDTSTLSTTTEGKARVGRPRDESREQAILEAAFEMLAEQGYDRLSMEAVAQRARASKATIYRRWSSKGELVAACLECRKNPELALKDHGSLREDLLAIMSDAVQLMDSVNGDLMLSLASATREDPALLEAFRNQMDEGAVWWVDMLKRAADRGEISSSVPPSILDEVIPAQMMMRRLRDEPFDEAFIVHLVDHVVLPILRAYGR